MGRIKGSLEWFDMKEFFDILREIIIVAICIVPIAIITKVLGMSGYGQAIVILIIGLPLGLILDNRRRKG